MSRYLTPTTIGLLVLASLYTEELVPDSEANPVLSFLLLHILHDNSNPFSEPTVNNGHGVPVSEFESALDSYDSGIPGRNLWDLYLRRLWSLDCFDSLDRFLADLPTALIRTSHQTKIDHENGEEITTTGTIVRTSPLGVFIRRNCLEYTRLQFQDSVTLWQDFIAYRAPTCIAWQRRTSADSRSAFDVNISDLRVDNSHALSQLMYGHLLNESVHSPAFSTYEVEKLMEFQVSELQRESFSEIPPREFAEIELGLGGRLPDEMRRVVDQMPRNGIPMPKLAYYLRFLDSWRGGDYSSAFDNLRRYFDYTMQGRDRTFYQYALLNLAILQADFGCYKEAISAMQEAIATARENKDTTCLNFCMSWLYHFGKTFPLEMKELRESGILGSEAESLAFLKFRAKDAEMWSLLSTSLLSEAKLGLQYGDSVGQIFENIAKAKHLNVTKSVSVVGPALLMQASVYGRVGLAHLAWSCGETFLQCYSCDSPAEDILKCTCRMASLLVQKGRYIKALELINCIPKHILRVLKHQQYWIFFAGVVNLRRCLHRGDLEAATNLLQRLQAQGAPDIELWHSLGFLEVELLMRRGRSDAAMSLVENLAARGQFEGQDVLVQVKLLLAKAKIVTRCGHPLKGFSISVRAATLAFRSRLLPALWEATSTLSNILVEICEFAAAVALLEAIIPHVLECQDSDLAAGTFSYLADARIGLAGVEGGNEISKEEQISKALIHIECAFQHFKFVDDLEGQAEMLAKRAALLHRRGDLVLANDIASQYLTLRKLSTTGQAQES